ncbi:hypothetical protein K431DRAFT_323971 [Polychaeton citri CBS 116435]|uniref:White collar 1 protein n=1 Tax=Polychaeton citri CBS 116435 TaxID=1314669 RepID=A0A9P4PY55_9PEZI|nr:hypothetical protein K431DRAFT_323971 [Polychaeton citri CBS 116435]
MGQENMGQSLDDIVNQNSKAMRRQSMPQNARQMSMADYGGSPFSFDASGGMSANSMMSGNGSQPGNSQQRRQQGRRQSNDGGLALNTSLADNAQGYNNMMTSHSAYASPNPGSGVDMSMANSPFIDPALGMSMNYNLDQHLANSNAMGADSSAINMMGQSPYPHGPTSSPMHSSFAQGTPNAAMGVSPNPDAGVGMDTQYSRLSGSSGHSRTLSRSQSLNVPAMPGSHQSTPQRQNTSSHPPSAHSSIHHSNQGFAPQPQNPQPGSRQDRGMGLTTDRFDGINGPLPVDIKHYNPNSQNFPWEPPEGGWPSTMIGRPHAHSTYKNAYSASGFDMLGVLMRVATRPNPEINIGSVDLSCAFVVCDAEKDDFPIVYCSDNFERLTGYTKHMILGRNCRFLQSPDGNVAPGVPRKYVDDNSVLYLKNMINLRREAQISLINYRRGGQPFMNLLTMIPITWDTEQVKFFVGFQVDLVEQPNAVTNRNPDGSYSINYQRSMTMPRYVVNAPEQTAKQDLGQTIPRDDVSAILSTMGSGDGEYAKRMWDKVLLENTDDVVHVLSLKGLFQWVSPSAAKVLEYEPGEIIGTALSSICHPSDIVPVTRELKDTSSGASVNVVFRIRRKNSGYMWFEGHGSLHTEQGKGRKSIIMVGRERPVYTLSKFEITSAGGIGENELWTKLSTSGMFLFVSSNVRQLLDRQPDELVGVSIQTLMRTDSKTEFGRILEHARTGKKASVKHEMINRRGQVLSAFTTLYPGDATEGQKPTFILAQTRLIKFSRGSQPTRPGMYGKTDRPSNDSEGVASQQGQSYSASTGADSGADGIVSRFVNTDGSAATYAGQNGLTLGRQDVSLASEDNMFDELKTTKSSSWQYEIRQLEKRNRMLAEEVQNLIAAKKKRKRRKGAGNQQKDCANCHTRVTPEWRRGPSGQRDLCNSCGLRWAKLNGRVSPRTSSQQSVQSAHSDKASKASASPRHQPKAESPIGQNGSTSNAATPINNPASPKAIKPTEGHAAHMEGASGVPDKIDEGIEPD